MKSSNGAPTPQGPLAIIGMGCLYPGADGLEAYWALIKQGLDAITDVPETHWRPEDYYSEDQKKPDFTYGRRGGFLSPVPFDPMKYGIPPNVIEATDTSQLLAMVVAETAMRDAGYGPERDFDHEKVSVVLGVTGALELVIPLGARLGHPLWRKALRDAGVPDTTAEDVVRRIADQYVDWQEGSFPGLLGNVVAGRVSKHLDLGGTNCVVDAACASSLSALHLAALELNAGKADMVVTGGIDTFNDIFMYMCFSKTPALSPTGNAKPFDHEGDGTILGEGLGMLVLKRLADAERDGDRVYAVLRGIGSSSDGKGEAIYAPVSEGQMKALRGAYRNAEVAPSTVELVEAHGTGTKKGDAVEIAAIKTVYADDSDAAPWCALGSVKSQIGHTKAAAGSAGLIKAALALHRKVLPPTIKVTTPQDAVAPGTTPFYVNTIKRPWVAHPDHPRRAAVSSFGFGGSNFHCVLEEHEAVKKAPDWDGAVQIIAYSGDTQAALTRALDRLLAGASWIELRVHAAESRKAFRATDAHRVVLVIEQGKTDFARLVADAKAAVAGGKSPENIYYGSGRPDGKIACLFPGQGAQYVGMLRDLACQFPEMIEVLSEAEAVYRSGPQQASLRDRIYPHPTFDKASAEKNDAALTQTHVAQPALGTVGMGAYRVLERFGLRANATAGHSYGELTALCAAGRFDVRALVAVSEARGRLMGAGEGDKGTMLAVKAPLADVERVLRDEALDVILANKNSPEQAVLSGTKESIERAAAALKKHGMTATRLNVAAAFHSRLVADAVTPFAEALKGVAFEASSIPAYSNTTAGVYPSEADAARDLLANQLARPVEFVGEIEALYAVGVRTFVEVGPGARLTGLVRAILGDRPFRAVALDASNGKKSGIADLARVIASLAAEGRALSVGAWDGEFVAPEKESGKPRMTIPICGANHRSPRKPRAAALAPKPAASAQPVVAQAPVRTTPTSSPALSPAPIAAAPPIMPVPMPTGGAVAELMRQTQDNIALLQRMQEQTASLHKQFLDGQEAASRALQSLVEQQRNLFSGAGHIVASAVAPPLVQAPQQIERVAAAAPAQPESPSPAPQVVVLAKPASPSVTAVLLAVVSEKTGYPVDMLDVSMSLDADLGIDSIKRVEILSALQERLPELPSVAAEDLGRLHTLQDVIDYLGAAGPLPAASDTPGESVDSGRVRSILLEVVSEKTGYPVDMLDISMSLDADLGIDSIKRVEILSALQERLPELPSVAAEDLGRLHTLQDVIDHLAAASPVTGTSIPSIGSVNDTRVRVALLEVVAEKTGYPVDMLDTSMSLDADLGIDSIKRVEILSALQERLPELPTVAAEDLGRLHTLEDVIAHLTRTGGAPAQASVADPSVSRVTPPAKEQRLERKVPMAVPMATPDARPSMAVHPGARAWVSDDGSDFSRAVADEMKSAGFSVSIVAPDFTGAAPETLDSLVLIAPEAGIDDEFIKRAFRLTQLASRGLRAAGKKGAARFATVSRLDGGFGLVAFPAHASPLSGGLAGLSKTAGHEWPEVACKAIDVASDFADVRQAASALVYELLRQGPTEVGLSRTATRTIELRNASLESVPSRPNLDSTDVVVVSGGARGVTAETAIAIARETRCTLVLLGRSALAESEDPGLARLNSEADLKKAISKSQRGLKPKDIETRYREIMAHREMRSTLSRIREAGAKAIYRAVDIRDAGELRQTIDSVRKECGRITAVVHGAGVLADRLILDKTQEQFDNVYDTKVIGLRNLLDASRDDPLKALVLFSSSTARFGRTGQADYAIANEILNKVALAEAAARPDCRVRSINWGPWDGGMVTPALRALFEREGVGAIGLDAGARQLVDEINGTDSAIEVVVLATPPGGATIESPVVNMASAASDSSLPEVVELTLSPSQHPFLNDHVIDGKAVLPVAMYVEWLAHAALHGNPGLRFQGIDDLRVLKGVVLEADSPRSLRIHAGKAEKQDGAHVIPVEIRSDISGRNVLHARAGVVLAGRAGTAPAPAASPNLQPYTRLRDEWYNNGLLFHGPMFQCLASVDGCSKDGIAVSAKTAPRPSEWMTSPLRKSWLSDPLAIDAAFQALILWSFELHQAGSLPVHFARFRQYQAAFPKGRVSVVCRIVENNAHKAVADVDFIDPASGTLVARMERYECVIDAALNAAFHRNRLIASASGH